MTCVDEVFGKRRVSRLARAVLPPFPLVSAAVRGR
jgi:hypothetical protein